MTTLQKVEIKCPVCDTTFGSTKVVSTNAFGGKRTDFHERAAGAQPVQYEIHTCVRCGFSGTATDFDTPEAVTPTLKRLVWAELAPRVLDRFVGSDKYDAAAKIAIWREADVRDIADRYLRAAWCCVDEEDVEAERYYRIKAAQYYEQALTMYGAIDTEERAVLTYLTGELWRRSGHIKRAHEWFDKVLGEIVDFSTQSWIRDAAAQQKNAPREWFG